MKADPAMLFSCLAAVDEGPRCPPPAVRVLEGVRCPSASGLGDREIWAVVTREEDGRRVRNTGIVNE